MAETQSVRPLAVKAISRSSDPKCKLCRQTQVYRMQRMGWLENGFYSLFGYYPWRCAVCRTKIYLRNRGSNGGKVHGTVE